MGFTIEDMLTVSRDKYDMEIIGGHRGWANSISWILLIEDQAVLRNFKGKDLAVTTGFGFDTEEKLQRLVEELVRRHASGLIINTGMHIMKVPDSVIRYSDENDFPLLTVPWSTELYDLIKVLSARIFMQSAADEQISNALIQAIEDPNAVDRYQTDLLPYFDTDGSFQVALITTGNLDVMDTVDRRSLSYRLQIYLENITHNGNFFYFDSCFALVMNALSKEQVSEIVSGFARRVKRKMPDMPVTVGVGSVVMDVKNLHIAYKRARAALDMALQMGQNLLYFDDMGIYRLLALMPDQMLMKEMGDDLLAPLIAHDRKKDTDYVETLGVYLNNNGSIQAVAEELYTHRNTVIYRVNNIKKLLNSNLETADDRMKYQIACMIHRMERE
ncbi:MAG: PucR family transcriptional regulator ligand-binding domain-containing protein [Blautia sp.]|nr:PucR family transcriptional regulator ligand-binding domain-containing protein [Blautia sp.]